MKVILVTGGAGFIGGCFVRMAIARGDTKIINLDKLTYAGNLQSLRQVSDSENHVFVQGDIGDEALLNQLLDMHRPDAVVNFAAESHVDRSITGPLAFVETNVMGTCRLMQAARRYWDELPDARKEAFRFLHVSTDEVYGSLGATGAFTETTRFAPNSPYAASKAASDHFVRAYYKTYGFPVVITNCSNNYGPYQFPEKLIPLMVLNALEGKALPIYGDGMNIRDWLYVEDHCRAIDAVLAGGRIGETYNVGGNAEHTNIDVVNTICSLVDKNRPELEHRPCTSLITYVKDRPGHDRRYAIDASKLERELKWTPQETFETGLAHTVAWYLSNPDWVEGVTSGNYQRERLGLLNDAR